MSSWDQEFPALSGSITSSFSTNSASSLDKSPRVSPRDGSGAGPSALGANAASSPSNLARQSNQPSSSSSSSSSSSKPSRASKRRSRPISSHALAEAFKGPCDPSDKSSSNSPALAKARRKNVSSSSSSSSSSSEGSRRRSRHAVPDCVSTSVPESSSSIAIPNSSPSVPDSPAAQVIDQQPLLANASSDSDSSSSSSAASSSSSEGIDQPDLLLPSHPLHGQLLYDPAPDDEDSDAEFDCPICFTTHLMRNTVRLGCEHRVCKECLLHYLKVQLREGDTLAIPCLYKECALPIQGHELVYFVDVESKIDLRKNPDVRWCPKDGCGKGNIGSAFTPHISCEKCQHEYCYHCGENWHEGSTCNENKEALRKAGKIDLKTEKWKERTHTKLCPQCKSDIEKDVGCNHMKCGTCKYEFCWLCMRQCAPDHYDAENWENGCPNQCFDVVEPRPSRTSRCLKTCGATLCVALACIVCFVPVLVLLPFYGCVKYCTK